VGLLGDNGSFLPKKAREYLLVGTATSTSGQWQQFSVPKYASMVYVFLCGSGAGGGAGLSASSAAAGGGGSGGSGTTGSILIPARFLPRTL
jgi:hypothetical protein